MESTTNRFKRRWKPELPNLENADKISIDTESCDPLLKEYGAGVRRNGYTVGISVAAKFGDEYKGWYIPSRHDEGENIDPDLVRQWANKELGRESQEKIFANAIYDLDYLQQDNIHVKGKINDIQIAEPLIDENQFKFSLEVLANKYLGTGKYENELDDYCRRVFGNKVNPKAMIHKIPSNIVRRYAEIDAIEPLKIFEKQQEIITDQGIQGIYDLESELIPILLKMKRNGIRVDTDRAGELEQQYNGIIKANKARLDELAGYNVNVNASASLAIYCDKMGIEYPLSDKSQRPSFTKPWMEKRDEEFFELVTSLKQDSKLSGDFFNGVILKYAINNRIHCQLNQLKSDEYGTVSGRFSSSLPNLQQIPSPEKALGPLARSLFLPEEGCEWVCFDYMQIEPRLALHYAKGKEADAAREFFRQNPRMDSYKTMVDALWDYIIVFVPESRVRKMVKTIYLGIAYGMGVKSTIQRLGLTIEEGNRVLNAFHKLIPYMKQLSDDVKRVAESRGYVKTILGRRRRFETYEPAGNFGKNKLSALPYDMAVDEYGHNIVRAYTYKALNSVIQGGSADLTKKAMIDISKSGVLDHCRMLLTVHDEIDFSIPKTKVGQECKKEIQYLMENAIKLSVPTPVDVEWGKNWGNISNEN